MSSLENSINKKWPINASIIWIKWYWYLLHMDSYRKLLQLPLFLSSQPIFLSCCIGNILAYAPNLKSKNRHLTVKSARSHSQPSNTLQEPLIHKHMRSQRVCWCLSYWLDLFSLLVVMSRRRKSLTNYLFSIAWRCTSLIWVLTLDILTAHDSLTYLGKLCEVVGLRELLLPSCN